MKRILRAFPGLVAAVLLGACGTRQTVAPQPTIESAAPATKYRLHAGVYYGPEFLEARFTRTTRLDVGFLDRRAVIPSSLDVPLGRASFRLYGALLERLFEKVTWVSDITEQELSRNRIDVLVVPSLEHFDLPHGVGPAWTPPVLLRSHRPNEHSIAYRTTLYSRAGVPLASWVVSGSADPSSTGSASELVDAYIKDAAEKFLAGFDREAGAVLAMAAGRGGDAGAGADLNSVTIAARPEPFPGVDPASAARLAELGVLTVRVTVQSPLDRALVVRASDMRLRLADGRIVEPAALSTILPAWQRVATEIAARRKPAPLEAMGNALGAMVDPVGHVVGDAVFGNLMQGQAADKQQQLSYEVYTPALFGERKLTRGSEEKGLVFFRLWNAALAAKGAVTAWVVDPAAGAGSQVEAPLP